MKISIAPATLLLMAVLAVKGQYLLPAGLLAALVHELGHLAAAKYARIPLRRMEIDMFGAKLYPASLIPSYRAEAVFALSGPLFSFLLGGFVMPHGGAFALALREATLSFGLFNLLPIQDLDGGRVLYALLSEKLPQALCDKLLSVSSYLCLLLLFLLSSCVLLRYGESLALAVLSASLFAKLFL